MKTYTASGFLNSLTYLNQYNDFKEWVFAMIWLSILVLVLGVAILSTKKPESVQRNTQFDTDDEEGAGVQTKGADEIQLPTLPKINRKKGMLLLSSGRDGPTDPDADDEVEKARESVESEISTKSDLPRRPSFKEEDFGNFVESSSETPGQRH